MRGVRLKGSGSGWFRPVMVSALAVGLGGISPTGMANAAQAVWSTQADFESNASTTGTPTNRVNVDTTSLPGSVKIGVYEDVVRTATVAVGDDKIYSIGPDRTSVAVIDGISRLLVKKIPLQAPPSGLVYNPEFKKIYVGHLNSDKVTIIDATTDSEIAVITLGNGTYASAYNPLNKHVYIANTTDGTLSIVDGSSNAEVSSRLKVAPGASEAFYDSAKNILYLTSKSNRYMTVIDGASEQVVKNVAIEAPVSLLSGMRFDAPAKGVLTANAMHLSWDTDCLRAPEYKEQVEFQVRTAADLASLSTAVYHGPDGTADTWYQTGTACSEGSTTTAVTLDTSYAPLVEVQAKLSSDGRSTPVLHEVALQYENFADLVVANVGGDTPITAGANSSLSVPVTVKNQGDGTAGQSTVRLYLYKDATQKRHLGDLQAGQLASQDQVSLSGQFTVTTPIVPGLYRLMACADHFEEVPEADETNNCAFGPDVTINGTDLVVTKVEGTVTGGYFQYSIEVKNQGNVTSGVAYVKVYASLDNEITTADRFFNVTPSASYLAGGASKVLTGSIVVPSSLAIGDYYLGAVIDCNSTVAETDETNNATSSISSQLITNDLIMPVEATLSNGQLTYTARVKNTGNGSVYLAYYEVRLSLDPVVGAPDQVLASGSHYHVKSGEDKVITGTIDVSGAPSGTTYYVGTKVWAAQSQYDSDTSNNTAVVGPLTIP